jgi:hypothetical protein
MKQVGSRFDPEGGQQTEIDDSRLLMIWTAVTAITLFCAAVISTMEGWHPTAMVHTGASSAPAATLWQGTNRTLISQPQMRRALFAMPADHTEANKPLKTTKG